MSVETLRRAAALMRERAEAATPSPWRAVGDQLRATAADALIEDNILVAYATGHDHRLGIKKSGAAPDAEHAASWHPDVALAVADWLDLTADFEPQWAISRGLQPVAQRALAVARTYLGEAQP